MFEKLIELRQKRGAAIAAMRAVQEKAEKEKRSLNAEEEAQLDRADKEQDELRGEIEKLEKEEARAKKLAGLEGEASRSTLAPVGTPGTAAPAGGEERQGGVLGSAEYRSAIEKVFRFGREARFTQEEARALQADAVTKGGFLLAPIQMVNEFIKSQDDQVFVRQYATKHTVTDADGLGAPALDSDLDDFEWTPELKAGGETELAVGARELRPHGLSKEVTISRKLLRKTAGSAATLAMQRLAYKFAVTAEKAFLLGDGDRKPLGVFVASEQGVPTTRDVEAGTAAGDKGPSADGLIDVKHSLKAA
jgi:HK97 family phage major capsid protein